MVFQDGRTEVRSTYRTLLANAISMISQVDVNDDGANVALMDAFGDHLDFQACRSSLEWSIREPEAVGIRLIHPLNSISLVGVCCIGRTYLFRLREVLFNSAMVLAHYL